MPEEYAVEKFPLLDDLIAKTRSRRMVSATPTVPIWAEKYRRTADNTLHPDEKYMEAFYGEDLLPSPYCYDRWGNTPPPWRATCDWVSSGYSPCLETQWFHPFLNFLHGSKRPYGSLPINLDEITGILADDTTVHYGHKDGKLSYYSKYTHKIPKWGESVELDKLNDSQNLNYYYVGLTEAQRACLLFAVNGLLIPMLNGDVFNPNFRYFLPNLDGIFSATETWENESGEIEENYYHGMDFWNNDNSFYRTGEHYQFISSDVIPQEKLQTIENKIIILRRALRLQHSLSSINYDELCQDPEALLKEVQRHFAAQDDWRLPFWYNHTIPQDPAKKFYKRVLNESDLSIHRIFGRTALWDQFGKSRAGFMTEYDLVMIKMAIDLVLSLDRLVQTTMPNAEEIIEVSKYLFGLGFLQKPNHLPSDDELDWQLERGTKYASFYDYSQEEIADEVYAATQALFKETKAMFTTAVLDHLNALQGRVLQEKQAQPDGERDFGWITKNIQQEKNREPMDLPLNYSMRYDEFIFIIRQLSYSLHDFLWKSDSTLDCRDVRTIKWYHPTDFDGAGVFHGIGILELFINNQGDIQKEHGNGLFDTPLDKYGEQSSVYKESERYFAQAEDEPVEEEPNRPADQKPISSTEDFDFMKYADDISVEHLLKTSPF